MNRTRLTNQSLTECIETNSIFLGKKTRQPVMKYPFTSLKISNFPIFHENETKEKSMMTKELSVDKMKNNIHQYN